MKKNNKVFYFGVFRVFLLQKEHDDNAYICQTVQVMGSCNSELLMGTKLSQPKRRLSLPHLTLKGNSSDHNINLNSLLYRRPAHW